MKEFHYLIRNLLGLIAILAVLFGLIIGIRMVPDDDMEPRLSAGDLIVFYKMDRTPDMRDLVVLRKNETVYIGRVIAAGGDKVDITDDAVIMINDNVLSEANIYGITYSYEEAVTFPLILEDDEYFVLCDRREGGRDSRYYGPVKKDEILGTVIAQYRRGSS